MWRGFKQHILDAALEAATIAFPDKREQVAALSVFADQLVRLADDDVVHFVCLLPQRIQVAASSIAPHVALDAETIVSQNSQDNLLRVSLSTKMLSHAFFEMLSRDVPASHISLTSTDRETHAYLLSRISALDFAFTRPRFDVATLTEQQNLSNVIVGVEEVSAYFAQRNTRTEAYKHLLCALDSARTATLSGRAAQHDAYELWQALENALTYHSVTDSTDGGTTIQLQILVKSRALLEERLSVRDS